MSIFVPPVGPQQPQLNERELAVQRRLTKAFIDTAPVALQLVPRVKNRKPSGGFAWEEQPPRSSQVFKLIEPGTIPLPIRTVDGVQREVEFELLGVHDAVIGQHDVFSHGGHRWEVLEVAFPNGWEQRALVARYGVGQGTVTP